uniref:Uncharacterized protein n=1 Tax=Anguilla anguilla TaxID=7936 RepID=A0A0E9XLW3_ANGAN
MRVISWLWWTSPLHGAGPVK